MRMKYLYSKFRFYDFRGGALILITTCNGNGSLISVHFNGGARELIYSYLAPPISCMVAMHPVVVFEEISYSLFSSHQVTSFFQRMSVFQNHFTWNVMVQVEFVGFDKLATVNPNCVAL